MLAFFAVAFLFSCSQATETFRIEKKTPVEENPQEPQNEQPQTDETPEAPAAFAPTEQEIALCGLPVVRIDVADGQAVLNREDWLDATISLENAENSEWNFEGAPAKVKGRGNSSWNYSPKKSYAVKFESRRKICGIPKHKRWVLLANYFDKSLLRNEFASNLGRKVFDNIAWNPRFEHVVLLLNGEFLGDYLFGEQIRIDKNRVDIEETAFSPSNPEGSFICEVTQYKDDSAMWRTKKNVQIALKEPDDFAAEAKSFAKSVVQAFEDAIYEKGDWRVIADENSLIDWYLTNEVAKNYDAAMRNSVYFYYDAADKKIHFGPNWDFDLAFGNFNFPKYDTFLDDCKDFYISRAPWFSALFEDETFRQNLASRWREVFPALLQETEKIPQMAEKIEKSARLNFQKWRILGIKAWANEPSSCKTRLDYKSEVEAMQSFVLNRLNWLDGAMEEM